jgi:hypothetical protein
MFVMLRLLARSTSVFGNRQGLALPEFAIVLPVLTVLIFYGSELANYALTRQRVSQLALQVADNASRIGVQEVLRNRPITEQQINDLFVGAALQGGSVDVKNNGRIILSGLTVNSSGGQWIQWQRCSGSMPFSSHYGSQGDGASGSSLKGMGPGTTKITASKTGPVVFAEVAVKYTPIISTSWAPSSNISEIASFAVRDDRDTSGTGIRNDEKVTVSDCS